MPKLYSTNIKLQNISELEHNHVIMHNKAGYGGGQHLMRDIWDSTIDDPIDQKYLTPFIKKIMTYFTSVMTEVKIRNYRIEHRIYIMDETPFTGQLHDDSCEYSAVLYYRIDDDIQGGQLLFYDDDANHIIDTYQPTVGDLVIFNGVHSVGPLYAKKTATRSIIIVHINSED